MNGLDDFHRFQTDCWEEYRPKWYVERPALEKNIMSWLNSPISKRFPVRSVIGPPGIGKSWLLANLHQKMKQTGAFVLTLESHHLMDHGQHNNVKNEFIKLANTSCPGLDYPQDLTPSLPAIVAGVRARLCNRCTTQQFLILVDGCDDLGSQEAFDSMQNEYLAPFFGDDDRCFCMIVARRLELTDPHLRSLSSPSLIVGVFENPSQAIEEQYKKTFDLATKTAVEIPDLPEGCTYGWNHPYINCYLLKNSQLSEKITANTLIKCCLALIKRSRLENPAEYPDSVIELRELRKLACELGDVWTSDEFRHRIQKDLDDTYLLRGLISLRRPHYTIVDGLRELLRSLPEKGV